MSKKIILISLISLSVFIVGSSNKQVMQPVSNTITSQDNTKPATSQSSDKTPHTAKNSTIVTKSSNAITYQITKNVYKNKNVIIKYPQIMNFGENAKQEMLNKIIKDDALRILNNYKGVTDELSLEITYNIKLENTYFLSIQYSGYTNIKGAAHPTNIFYTTNIDIENGKKLRLADLVKIDEAFVKNFKKGQFIDWQGQTDSDAIQRKSAVISAVNDLSSKDLIKYFNESDNMGEENASSTFSYLAKNSLGISVNIPHAIGDHGEFEMKYKDISDNINTEYKVLKNLYNPS